MLQVVLVATAVDKKYCADHVTKPFDFYLYVRTSCFRSVERIVNEHVTSAGCVLGMTITKELLTSCRASRTRYANHCDEVRRAKLS